MTYRARKETLCLRCMGNVIILIPHLDGGAAPAWLDYGDPARSTRFIYVQSRSTANNLLHFYTPAPSQVKPPRTPGILSGFLGK